MVKKKKKFSAEWASEDFWISIMVLLEGLKASSDKVVVELGVVFGGDAVIQVNKHSKCHHYKRNHHR